MTKYAITATADNKLALIEFDESKSYKTIKEAVGGGCFDCIHLPTFDVDMWIDDEGKLVENPEYNPMGTTLWVIEYGPSDIVVGDIIITGGTDAEGKTLGMTKEKALEVLTGVQKFSELVLQGYQEVETE